MVEFNKTDFHRVNLLMLWWKDKTGADISHRTLTDHGFMVYSHTGRPLAAAFLYPIYGCETALVGFPISNPNVFYQERREALAFLVAGIEKRAKEMHYKTLLSYAGSKGAKEMFDRLGYKVGDTEVVSYVKVLEV